MSTVFCDNCGVSLLEETARFCRACGKPTPPLSEAATKRFDQPAFQTPTSPVGPSPTTPAYMAPFEFPAASQTVDFNRKRKRNLILLAAMLSLMIFALGGLFIFLRSGDDGIPPGPPPPMGTKIPGAPGVPPLPGTPVPPVPPPPAPPFVGTPGRIDQSLIYPGSKETMTITAQGVTSTIKLQSDDAASKVANWYLSRLKVTNKFSIAGQTIIQAGDTNVVVMGGDDGAEILITVSNKDSKN